MDKEKLIEQLNYFETQYSCSSSEFDHGIVFLCRCLLDSIKTGIYDKEVTPCKNVTPATIEYSD